MKQHALAFWIAVAAVHWAGVGMAWVSDGVSVCTAEKNQFRTRAISDGAGGAIVVWDDDREFTLTDVYAQRLSPSGSPMWVTNGVAVVRALGYQTRAEVATDEYHGALVTWVDGRSFPWTVYAQRIDSSGVMRWLSSVGSSTNTMMMPQITPDGSGGCYVAWADYGAGNYDIRIRRFDANGLLQWAGPVTLCSAFDDQLRLRVVPDGAGGAIVAWEDRRNDSYFSDLYAQRINASGMPLWAANGIPVVTGPGDVQSLHMIPDGAGGAIMTWTDGDVRVQRIQANGSRAWVSAGVLLCNATGWQSPIGLAPDGANGAIVAWSDPRAGLGNENIFAGRVDGGGLIRWASNGVALCMAPGSQESGAVYYGGYPVENRPPQAISDGQNGIIVSWTDYRSGTGDIYAMRADVDGNRLWPTDGVPICTATGNQVGPVLVTDGASGALVAWDDRRDTLTTGVDVYAQRVTAAGTVPTVGVGHPLAASFAVTNPAPNPARRAASIAFELPSARRVTAEVFDLGGRAIRTLAFGEFPAGRHTLTWTGADGLDRPVAGGVYFVRIRAGAEQAVRRLVLLRP